MNKGNKRVLLAILLSLAFLLFGAPNPIYARGDATGADTIFDIIGVVKPSDWDSMSRSERFSYLENLGAYPANGDKYQGSVDVNRYFETLGVQEPENWMGLSSQERINFITSLKESQKELVEKDSIVKANTENRNGKEYNFPFIGTGLVLLYLGSLGLVRVKKISLLIQRRIWNILLGTFFLSTAILGILLVIRISYGFTLQLPFNMLFWHVETGIAFSVIAIFHILWHFYYFKLIFKK